MNTYLMSVKKYFGGTETFEVEAENKSDAIEKAKFNSVVNDSSGNVKKDTLKVVKKLKK